MSQKDKNYFYLYSVFLVLFLLITNEFYTYEETLKINQYDGRSYFKISIFPFDFANNIPFHHAQRFYLPFIIGVLANIFEIDNFLLFRLICLFTILIVILIHIRLINRLKINFKDSIISTTLIFLNPYLFRYFISVPTMINDLYFILALYVFLYAVLINHKFLLLSLIISLISRQTGLFILIGFLYFCYNKKYYQTLFIGLFISCFIFFLSNYYAQNSSISGFNFDHLVGFFKSIFFEDEINKILNWIFLPFYSFLPLIFYLFLKKFEKEKFLKIQPLIIFFIFLSTVGISYLAGPELAGRNIIRQTSIVIPLLVFLILVYSKNRYNNMHLKIIDKILILLIFISSLHPIYSKIKLLEQLKII
ncbi:MAG: hypothetical protein CMI79_03190 [Candidatus Pelagibacter sp.]|nr:hypothetical protein [Candidatus Pelagibacter sp.]|tara:strand:- start:1364 stop:2452 length:1089 start_codon:yes stop_codon:yes gene_type:complete